MHCPAASHSPMDQTKDSGACRMSSVDGPSGTKSTIMVHQIESMASALARCENVAYRIGKLDVGLAAGTCVGRFTLRYVNS